MRLNRLTKLAQLMNEAKEQYFNLYNDMKDSIYVEQKGRTVGDVEVLPGKTLSGCITSSNINVYYTNLMGGKESKVISSSELIALIPSLTTKKGELSPTLNISKVLINTSIQKYNSANKLAELKKIAADGSAIDPASRLDLQNNTAFDVYLNQAQLSANNMGLKSGGSFTGIVSTNPLRISWTNGEGKSMSTIITDTTLKSFFKNDGKRPIVALSQLSNMFEAKNVGAQTKEVSTSLPQAARSPAATRGSTQALVIKHEKGTKLEDIGGTYTYLIEDPSSKFSYFNSAKPNETGKVFDKGTVSIQQWNKAVAVLNDDKKVKVTSKPQPAAPAAATDAAATGAATTPTVAENASSPAPLDAQEKVVSEVLAQMYGQKMAGTAGIDFKNEERILKITLDSLSGTKGAGQRYAPAIARVLLSQTPALKSSVPATSAEALANKPFLTNLQAAINSLYSNAFTWSRSQGKGDENHASLWKRIKAKTFSQADAGSILKSYMEKGLKVTTKEMKVPEEAPAKPAVTPPQSPTVTPPATTTAPPAAEGKADDGYKKSSSRIDPRIKKLATLRRLRVRSQMEAATDSSAQFGRSRVS